MNSHRLVNEANHLLLGLPNGDATREVRNVRAPACAALLEKNHVTHRWISYSVRPDFLSIARRVPGGMSTPGCPATVTVPRFVGCLNCLWLPRVRTRYHPSSSRSRMRSRSFKAAFPLVWQSRCLGIEYSSQPTLGPHASQDCGDSLGFWRACQDSPDPALSSL